MKDVKYKISVADYEKQLLKSKDWKGGCKGSIKHLKKWSQLPYAGETSLPIGIDPTAGSWPMYYLRHCKSGKFATLRGRTIKFNIQQPDSINFFKELLIVKDTMKNLTKEQRTIAEYWGEGPATKQWTPIIDRLLDTYDLSPAQSARVNGSSASRN